jgi:hypothetical protein
MQMFRQHSSHGQAHVKWGLAVFGGARNLCRFHHPGVIPAGPEGLKSRMGLEFCLSDSSLVIDDH